MEKKEYYNVAEVSKKHKISKRHIRNLIHQFKEENGYDNLLTKNQDGNWLIHHLILEKFNRQRKPKNKYYALTFDLGTYYDSKDINLIIEYVCNNSKDENLEFNYTIESKKSNGQNHIHAYTNCKKKQELLRNFKIGFSKIGYVESNIYDLENWKNYITKDGNKIITIKK